MPPASSTRRCRRCASRCGCRRRRRCAPCCSTCRSRSPRAGAAMTRPRTTGCSSCSGRSRTGARRCARCCGRARRSSCPAFDRLDRRGPRRAVQLRPRGRGVALPRRAVRRRGAARVPVQRQRLLHGRRRAADDAAVVEQRGGIPAAGAGVEGDDGALLPRHGVGAAEQGELRPAVGLQVPQRARDVGRRAREARACERPAHARRRGDVRGLHAVAVPPHGAEEPAPVDVRRRLPARVDRVASGRRRSDAHAGAAGERSRTTSRSRSASCRSSETRVWSASVGRGRSHSRRSPASSTSRSRGRG